MRAQRLCGRALRQVANVAEKLMLVAQQAMAGHPLLAILLLCTALAVPEGTQARRPRRPTCLGAYRGSLTVAGPMSGAPSLVAKAFFDRQAAECVARGFVHAVARFDSEAYWARVSLEQHPERTSSVLLQLRERMLKGLSPEERASLLDGFGLCLPSVCRADDCSLGLVVAEFFGLSFSLGRDASSLPAPRWCNELNVTFLPANAPRGLGLVESALNCRGFEPTACQERLALARAKDANRGVELAWEGSFLGQRSRFCRSEVVVRCTAQPSASAAPRGPEARRPKVAVLVSGVRERFYGLPTLQHVVAPAAAAGYDVDYYAALNWEPSHMLEHSPWSQSWLRPVSNPAVVNLSVGALREQLARHARHYGARRTHLLA
eukprot:CAMPEP_0204165158 /NCGR_PEP_ID=MMETSP0361-20130328/37884_1 /ASSEMBLY_ACC=CAM_ASM_000343 /TAXON_ID=268821 /ORGANISM="Scrippsiella Hangoei, Strain SHTV-5" /LENGTH=376 /DNA_ID=CAMNT_0051122121 /DNA_START=145 /DNA_END=1273 /DNA_ORIENTATION=+